MHDSKTSTSQEKASQAQALLSAFWACDRGEGPNVSLLGVDHFELKGLELVQLPQPSMNRQGEWVSAVILLNGILLDEKVAATKQELRLNLASQHDLGLFRPSLQKEPTQAWVLRRTHRLYVCPVVRMPASGENGNVQCLLADWRDIVALSASMRRMR